jgi:hypothetical protein
MKAHHLRLVGQERGEHVIFLDEAPVDFRQGRWRLGTRTIEFGAQPINPSSLD